MMRWGRWGVMVLLGAAGVRGEPVVAGYERFHAAQPSAAGGRCGSRIGSTQAAARRWARAGHNTADVRIAR